MVPWPCLSWAPGRGAPLWTHQAGRERYGACPPARARPAPRLALLRPWTKRLATQALSVLIQKMGLWNPQPRDPPRGRLCPRGCRRRTVQTGPAAGVPALQPGPSDAPSLLCGPCQTWAPPGPAPGRAHASTHGAQRRACSTHRGPAGSAQTRARAQGDRVRWGPVGGFQQRPVNITGD